MSTGKDVFIIGPGLIGWSVIDLLVAEDYKVTGLVRRKEHADGIEASGAQAILGDLNNQGLITEQAANHSVIIHTATADHLPSVKAVLEGIKQRIAEGLPTIFIHTSGTSVLDDGANGAFKSDKVYHDDKQEDVDSVPDDAPHRQIDLAIVKAKNDFGDKAKLAIMIPPLIYGTNHDRLTIQIPTLTRWAIVHGYAAHVGEGKAVESNIHVKDLARAYQVLLHHFENTTSSDQSLANPYFFCETTGDNEPSWRDVATAIGEALAKAGKIKDATPRPLPNEGYAQTFGDYTGAVIGLNSRSRANRLRALGWKPREKDWRSSFFEDELPEILKEDLSKFAGYGGTVAS